MRVLYLNPCGQMGGAETSLRELLSSMRSAAPAWELALVLGEDGPMAQKARALGVQVTITPFPPALARLGDSRGGRLGTAWSLAKAAGGSASYARQLAAVIRSIAPDIIHTNGLKMHLLGAWTRPQRSALVWHIHDYVSPRPLMSKLLRRNSRRCAAMIVNSRSVAADLQRLIPDAKITTIYNAVDLERFAPTGSRLDLDELAGLPAAAPGTVRVGLVGTFARWKGHEVFLRALAKTAPDSGIRGYVIGAPIYQTSGSQWSLQELQDTARRLGLADRVGFTGFLDDTAAAMRSLDIVVHASTQPEPFGMVIIEGMACGRAVIASRSGGAQEIFEEGKDALGHGPGDADELAAQILRLASDNALRSSFGTAGRARVERLFRGERLAQQLLGVYQRVAKEGDFHSVRSLTAELSSRTENAAQER